MKTRGRFLVLFLGLIFTSQAQDTLFLKNPSFEGTPSVGTVGGIFGLPGWTDCGMAAFPGETPPDVLPHPAGWNVTTRPHHGSTFISLVTRQSDTWELISQRLPAKLQPDSCYSLSVWLCLDPNYLGLKSEGKTTRKKSNRDVYTRSFSEPVVFQIWGGRQLCEQKVLLAETREIAHHDWREYVLIFKPDGKYQSITLNVYYDVPTLAPYNGHVLVDHLSPITSFRCDN